MASGFDVLWDYRELSGPERRLTRNYWEAFYVWIVLNPQLLKSCGGVDVFTGRIHRVIDRVEIWEYDSGVKADYARLARRPVIDYAAVDAAVLVQSYDD